MRGCPESLPQVTLCPMTELLERCAVVAETLQFVRGELRLHAETEEQYLDPEIAFQLRPDFGPVVEATPRRPLGDVVLLETAGTPGVR